jgi:dihydrofolate reductase
MRKLILYIATSVDGFIAGKDGSVSWLDQFSEEGGPDYGFHQFLDEIDTTIMGNATYQQIAGWDIHWPYEGKHSYVLSSQMHENNQNVEFISKNHLGFIKELKQAPGKSIWLVGGGATARFLMEESMLDEIRLFVMPVVLGDGIPLFTGVKNQINLNSSRGKVHENGVVEVFYELR